MLFNIEADSGAEIVGYIVPDDFKRTPNLRIVATEGEIGVFPCNEERQSLVAAGRHETGMCGFRIGDSHVPGLAARTDLSIYDVETGLLVYRRRDPSRTCNFKMFRLETHLFPLWRLDDTVDPVFQCFQKGVERHGRETSIQAFLVTHTQSLYLSGRVVFKHYEPIVEDVYKSITILHEPYVELAERLLTLRHVRNFGEEFLGARDLMTYAPAIDFARALEPSHASLRRAFASISKPTIAVLTDPVTRQLTAASMEEPAPKGGVARALQSLSRFAVVGVREREDLFRETLEATLGMPAGMLPRLTIPEAVYEMADVLRQTPEAELLLEKDLELYEAVRHAVEAD